MDESGDFAQPTDASRSSTRLLLETTSVSTSHTASSAGHLSPGALAAISERLSLEDDLPLPSSMYQHHGQAPEQAAVLQYLQRLLRKDPAAFLDRYGSRLQSQELNHFEALRDDYEVLHYLNLYQQAAQRAAEEDAAPGPGHSAKRLPAVVKNRRLAYMQRLHAGGEYFTDEAMRERAPLLYYEQVGQYTGLVPDTGMDNSSARAGGAGCGAVAAAAGAGPSSCASAAAAAAAGGARGLRPGAAPIGGTCLAEALRSALQQRCREDGDAPDGGPGSSSGIAAAAATESAGAGAGPSSGRTAPPGPGQAAAEAAAAPGAAAAAAAGAAAIVAKACGVRGPGGRSVGHAPFHGPPPPQVRGGVPLSELLMGQVQEAHLHARMVEQRRREQEQYSEEEEESGDEDGSGSDGSKHGDDGARSMSEDAVDEDDAGADASTGADCACATDDVAADAATDDTAMEAADGSGSPLEPGHAQQRQPAARRHVHARRHARRHAHRRGVAPSAAQVADMRRAFVSDMEVRFLEGADGEYVDYVAIDGDASLDADWLEQEGRDAEEAYFDAAD